jgi:hypothetical protein
VAVAGLEAAIAAEFQWAFSFDGAHFIFGPGGGVRERSAQEVDRVREQAFLGKRRNKICYNY